jgi:hypothetical protein
VGNQNIDPFVKNEENFNKNMHVNYGVRYVMRRAVLLPGDPRDKTAAEVITLLYFPPGGRIVTKGTEAQY